MFLTNVVVVDHRLREHLTMWSKMREKNLENNHDDAKVMVNGKIIVYPLEIHSQLNENKVFFTIYSYLLVT